ncbi:MAG: hypothetical protein V4611_02185 [Patescibacteria group bacterium]
MKKFIAISLITALSLAALISLATSTPASAIGIMDGLNAAHGNGTPTSLFGDGGVIPTITNTLMFLAGALAVIMLIFGGLRYTTSGGNSANVTAAKNTVLYAIVGLIISFLAFAAVSWVLDALSPGGAAGFTNV